MNTQQWNWPVRWLSLVVVPDGQTAELPKTLGCGHQEPVLVAGQEALSPGHGLAETVSGAVSPGPRERQADVRCGARVLPPARDDTHQVRVVVVRTVLMSYRHSPLHKQRDFWEVMWIQSSSSLWIYYKITLVSIKFIWINVWNMIGCSKLNLFSFYKEAT